MKKTVIALAIAALAAAGTSSAATVYNQDGTKVELGGSMRIFLGKLGKNQRGDLVNDGSRIKINASQALDNGLSAFVGYELRFERDARKNKEKSNNNFGDPTTRNLFVGLGFENVGKLSFGRQATGADDVVGDSLYYDSGALSPLTTRADKSVKFRSADFNGFSFTLDYLFGNAEKYTTKKSVGIDKRTGLPTVDETRDNYKNGYQASAFYNHDFAENHKFDVGLTYGVNQYDTKLSSSTNRRVHTWAASMHYQLDAFNFGTAYGQVYSEVKNSGLPNARAQYVFLEGKYNLNDLTGIPTTFGLQWERLGEKSYSKNAQELITNKVIKNHYIVNLDYKFNKHVVPYVSYIRSTEKDVAGRTNENIYGAGLRVFF
ncbi:porin [Aggregatibacter kilianii]|uniref:porin n=1 Tax=Aggregatibacter kilianii TaxID=2025884 RepID=UPI000D6871FB|nr:porin [Aggregatibacter kilianii]